MSWSKVFVGVKHPGDLDKSEPFELDGARDALVAQHADAEDQIDAAIDAAKALIESDAFGGEGKVFSVELSGHANPGHEPASGMSNDYVQVVVRQMQEVVTAGTA